MAANNKYKKRLATGGLTPEQITKHGNIGMGLQAGSQVINAVDGMDGKPSTLGGVASGAMSGASMGMPLAAATGGLSIAAGAAIGGGLALIQAEKAKKEEAEAKKRYMSNLTDQHNFTSQQTLRNYASQGVTSAGSYAYGGELAEYGKGGKIHIKPENRGKFTAYKKRTGKTTAEALHSKNPHVRQMANFARNAAKWKHKGRKKKHGDGGELSGYTYPQYPDGGKLKRPYANPIAESTGVAPSLTPMNLITGLDAIKDKETRDYIETNQVRIFDPNSQAGKEERRLLANAHFKYGNPTIRHRDRERASYYPNLNQINTNYKDPTDYEAELAHAQQYKDKGYIERKIMNAADWLKNPAFNQEQYDRSYDMPGTIENEAHSIIEPRIKKELANMPRQAVRNNRLLKELGKKQYAYGGMPNPEYEVEEDEMIQGQPMLEEGQQIASDMYKVGGEKHENGGTDGIGGDRVFSDRMKTSNKKTYAEEAEKLAKDKAKYEAKIPNTNEAVSNTGHRMSERMDMKLDELFNEQEMKKMYAMPSSISSSIAGFKHGGNLPKLGGGDNLLKLRPSMYKGKPLYYDEFNRKGAYALPNSYVGTLKNPNTQYFGAGQTGNLYPYATAFNPDTKRWYAHEQQKAPAQTTPATTNELEGLETTPPIDYQQRAAKDNLNQILSNATSNAALTTPVTEGGATAKAMKNGNGIPWQYVDNLAGGIATANTPQIPKPYLDPRVDLNTNYDINPQLSSARNTRDALVKSINASTPQGGASAANKQQLFATYNENANELYAQKNNIENELKNKEILLNSNINSQNNDKRYAYDVESVKRRAGIQEDIVGNARNFAVDQYTSARDRKMDERDLENIRQIAMANPNGINYGARLKAYNDMYASDPAKLNADITRLQTESPNHPDLPYLINMRKNLTGK